MKNKFWKPGQAKPDESLIEDKQNSLASDPLVGENSGSVRKPAQLSSATMKMKFMMRKSPKTSDNDEKERQGMQNSEKVTKDGHGMPGSGADRSVEGVEEMEVDPVAYLPGRRSFGGFNKIIERQYIARCSDLGFKNVFIGRTRPDSISSISHPVDRRSKKKNNASSGSAQQKERTQRNQSGTKKEMGKSRTGKGGVSDDQTSHMKSEEEEEEEDVMVVLDVQRRKFTRGKESSKGKEKTKCKDRGKDGKSSNAGAKDSKRASTYMDPTESSSAKRRRL